MKKQIRSMVFETNSSSVHSLTLVSKEDFEKWRNGEMAFNRWSDKLVPITDEVREEMKSMYSDYITYEYFEAIDNLETFEEHHTTKSGDEVVVFGYYGYDG